MQGSEQFLDVAKIVLSLGAREGQIVSDLGCGSGYFTAELGKRVGKTGAVYAVDIQESPLESVKMKAKAEGVENIKTIRANLEVVGSTGIMDTSCDIVLLANVLFQSSKKEEILKEAFRILKPQGEMVIIDWKKSAPSGPPMALRTSEEDMRKMVEGLNMKFLRSLDAGQFHFGMLFNK